MLSKYMQVIVDRLTGANFQFIDASQGGALENAVGAFWNELNEDLEAAAKMRMTMLTAFVFHCWLFCFRTWNIRAKQWMAL
jgi:hypothetical protein